MNLDVYLTASVDTGGAEPHEVELFSSGITHNLNAMAEEFGLYVPLWRPEEANITEAGQLVDILAAGLDRLKADPERARKFNPSNGWGTYEGLVEFVEEYLAACRKHPKAKVRVSR